MSEYTLMDECATISTEGYIYGMLEGAIRWGVVGDEAHSKDLLKKAKDAHELLRDLAAKRLSMLDEKRLKEGQ